MPTTAEISGPFSYSSVTFSVSPNNNYDLVANKTKFDPSIGETIEVYLNGTLLAGDGTKGSSVDALAASQLFYVDNVTTPTKVHLTTPNDGITSGTVLIKRISNRSTAQVDFAPGSVIREQDLDASTNQTLHVAQEAMDIALQGIVLDANDEWDAKSKVIKDVADGVADNDAVNKAQLALTEVTTRGYKEDTEDYKLETADWAQKVNGGVKVYTDNSVTGSALGFSAKAHAIGGTDVTGASGQGSAKDWAIGGGGVMATEPDGSEFSAKEYAQGVTATGGTSKEWAQTTGSAVASSEFSAKEYAQGTVATGGTSKEWATNAGSAEVATGAGYSSKAYAQDTGNDIGSSKDWATLATQVSSTDYSSKQYAVGTPPDGSAKEWAKDTGGVVADNEFSAKAYASEVGTNAPTVGSAKEWATTTGSAIASSEFSAKEYSQGETATGGSSKQWALGGGSFVEGTAVTGSSYSAKKYASDASASEVAARNSAAAVSAVYDNFSDVYLGSMADGATADTGSLTGATWAKDSSSIAFTGTTGTISLGQELTSTGTGYPVGANIIGSQTTTPLVISNPFTVAQSSGVTINFVGSGVYGAYNVSKDGPALNNDGDALVVGNLYFNNTDNEMRLYDGANWIAASAAGSASLLEYKFITTSGQVSSKTYSGTADVGGSLSYTQSNILVFLNGVLLKDTTDYTASNGTSVVLVAAPVLSDELTVVAFKSFTVADTVSAASGGTFSGAVTASAGFTANTADINGGTIDGSTITSPVINTGVSGTAVLDEDAMGSDSATKLATQQSIKAYVDSAGTNSSITTLGAVTAGNLANTNIIYPAGHVLQVKHFPYHGSHTITGSAASIPFTGSDSTNDYGCPITLSSASNKVLISVVIYSGNVNEAFNHQYKLMYNTSVGGTWVSSAVNGGANYWALVEHNTYTGIIYQTLCHSVNDYISANSETVWVKNQHWKNSSSGTAYIGKSGSGGNFVRGTSITLMEVQV